MSPAVSTPPAAASEGNARLAKIAPYIWIAWIALFAAVSAPTLLWQLDYFKHPGPQFGILSIVLAPAMALLAWIYAALRPKLLWRYELAAAVLIASAAALRYEPKAALVAALLLLSCGACGRFALRKLGLESANPVDRIALGFGAGCGLLVTLLFILGLLRLLYPAVFWILILASPLIFHADSWQTILDARELHRRWAGSKALAHSITGVAVFFGFAALACALMSILAPSIIFDALQMHLTSVQFYAAQHALLPVPGLDYSYYPQAIEMVWTLGYSLAGQPGAQVVTALFFPILLMVLYRLARQCGIERGTAAAGVLFAATIPFLHWTGSVMKNDLALALFQGLALYAFVRFARGGNFRWILAGTFFLAQSFGVKHIALFGAVPLVLLFAWAIFRQPRKWRAAALTAAVFVIFGMYWATRTYLLTGNPVAPEKLSRVTKGALGPRVRGRPLLSKAEYFVTLPWQLTFAGRRAFESPLRSPAGIILIAFAPLFLITAPRRPKTRAQYACVLYAGLYLLVWGRTIIMLRYAILPVALLAVLAAVWARKLYDSQQGWQGRGIRLSLVGVETYCLIVALTGVMIIEVNAPQLLYFAGRLDKAGYLESALATYPSLAYVKRIGGKASIFTVDNFSRAYAPDPLQFNVLECMHGRIPSGPGCQPATVLADFQQSGARYLILPDSGPAAALLQTLRDSLAPQRIYQGPNFAVYRAAPH